MSDRERAELVEELEAARRTNLPCLVHAADHPRSDAAPLWLERRAMRRRCARERPDLKR
jgi:hypothetical protein